MDSTTTNQKTTVVQPSNATTPPQLILERVGFAKRFLAYLLDLLFYGSTLYIIVSIFVFKVHIFDGYYADVGPMLLLVCVTLLLFFANLAQESSKGTSFGKKRLLIVTRNEDGSEASRKQLNGRALLLSILSPLFLVSIISGVYTSLSQGSTGYIFATPFILILIFVLFGNCLIFGKDKQTLVDKIFHTAVFNLSDIKKATLADQKRPDPSRKWKTVVAYIITILIDLGFVRSVLLLIDGHNVEYIRTFFGIIPVVYINFYSFYGRKRWSQVRELFALFIIAIVAYYLL